MDIDRDCRVLGVEREQPWEQPELRDGMGTQHSDRIGRVSGLDPVDTVLQAFEQGADFTEQAGASMGQANATGLTLEQGQFEVVFQGADLFADRTLGEAQLAGCAGKTAIAAYDLESDQAVQGRQVFVVAVQGASIYSMLQLAKERGCVRLRSSRKAGYCAGSG